MREGELVYAAANVFWVSPIPWLGWIDWFGWAEMIAVFWVVLNGVRSRSPRVALFLTLIVIALTSVALAQDGTPPAPTPAPRQPVTADDVNRIARQMYCPVCENEPLDACRTAACQQWRAQIGEMLAEGQSDQQIKDYFVTRYGVRVLAQPPAQGTSLLLYVLPIAGLMSDQPIEMVRTQMDEVLNAAHDLGATLHDPFMAMSFLALAVIPELKITDQGLVDVSKFQKVSLFVE